MGHYMEHSGQGWYAVDPTNEAFKFERFALIRPGVSAARQRARREEKWPENPPSAAMLMLSVFV